ncbi:MAG: hypothetical protein EP343_31410 [Deltaproteobacteria bacterium]|nr:MAG: hypothetical protein EP343_31410 [Deltaproteobacteria bacterium]
MVRMFGSRVVIGLLCWGLVASFSVVGGCAGSGDPSEVAPDSSSTDGGGTIDDGGNKDNATTADKTPQGQVVERKWTYRMIAGISMGGGMAAIVGLRNHEKFDIIGSMGAPNDLTYLYHYIERAMLGGFCDLKKIEEMATQNKLNTKDAYCAPPGPKPVYPHEFTSHFNDWHYDDAGGNWNRNGLIRVLQDLTMALGNPMYYNTKSPYWPSDKIPNARRAEQDRCNNPVKISGVKSYPYNPEGKYDMITFCDGNGRERSGTYHIDKVGDHVQPIEILLAVDVNGNGKRDYGEPIVSMTRERFDDVGKDGCTNDREDGKGGCVPEGQKGPGGEDPNGDDYHPLTNPTGQENNMIYDEGEPYKDFGIDGIENTKDYGEGDGKFTRTPNRENMMKHDPRTLVRQMSKASLDRLNLYLDGGIRDLFNFHISALHLLGAAKAHYPDQPKRAQKFDKFVSLLNDPSQEFDYTLVDWSNKGQHVYIQYGDPNATEKMIEQGDGDHVHGGRALDRTLNYFGFVTAQLPDPDLKPVSMDLKKGEGIAKHYSYDSKALGFKNIYSVVLPPGFYKDTTTRYPVVYFGHGYGMNAPDMANLLAIVATQMSQGAIAKMILVSLHGKCEQWVPKVDDPKSFDKSSKGDCHRGVFYLNAKGINNDGLQFEDSVFEVIQRIEQEFGDRIRKPETRKYKVPLP